MLPNKIVNGSEITALKKHIYVALTSRLGVDKRNLKHWENRDACFAVAELMVNCWL